MNDTQPAIQEPVQPLGPAERNLTGTLVLLIAVPALLGLLAWLGLLVIDAHERKGISRAFSASPPTSDQGGNLFVACRHWFTWHYAVLDIGDVRVAVRATRILPAPTGCSGSADLCVKSGSGIIWGGHINGTGQSGNPFMTWYVSCTTQNGMTSCQVGDTNPPKTGFDIKDSVISFADRQVRIGEGPKVVFLRRDGTVESVEVAKP